MTLLYQFWSHFLIRNFNQQMYNEFRSFAFRDVEERDSQVGMNYLREYYAKALSSPSTIRDSVAQHYIDLVKSNHLSSDRAVFKQLRALWRDGSLNLKNRKKLMDLMDSEFKASLEQ
jgi:la-related protein 1